MQKLKFPSGFLWGAASSAYQTEGGNSNADWWVWEHSRRRQEQLEAERKHYTEYQSGQATDFWNRFEEDFALAQKLNHTAIRIGLEWSRIELEEGKFDEAALDHYEKILQSAKFHGLQVFLTIHHYTSPVWFMKRGGFLKRGNLFHFLRFSEKVINRFHEYVDFWVTINEAGLYAGQGYLLGVHPPQRRSLRAAWKVVDNLIEAHKHLCGFIRQNYRQPVSMAYSLSDFQPSGWLGGLAVTVADYVINGYILNRTADYCDYIGVNYYFHHHIGILGVRKHSHSQHDRTDRGWGIHPDGIERVILSLKRYNKPIYILENGIADAKDEKREQFIKDHLFYVHSAIQQGADVRGYLYWSLTDNFEWEEGFWPRFGLIEIDYENLLRRRIRPSALAYAEICKENTLTYSG